MTNTSFGQVQQVEAGIVDVGYVDIGLRNGQTVMLCLPHWFLRPSRGTGSTGVPCHIPSKPEVHRRFNQRRPSRWT
jgi:hypothetical protein